MIGAVTESGVGRAALRRLPFVLPDFTRTSWASNGAREVWEPRIRQIMTAWREIEWMSVARGHRRACVTSLSPEEYVRESSTWAQNEIASLPLQMQGTSNYTYSSTSVRHEPGRPFVFRVVLGRPADLARFQAAFEAGDDAVMGELLGYPACCLEFYRRVWVEESCVDTTWAMAAGTEQAEASERAIEVSGPIEANILWRWMGLRAVPHLPCSFRCPATVEFGKKLLATGEEAGRHEVVGWLREILSWPAKWSALHGIAEVKTPILRVSTRTDATECEYVVRRVGSGYPSEGADGTVFPYRRSHASYVELASFRKGIENPIPVAAAGQPEWYARDNGFASRYAMEQAHEPILALARAVLGEDGGDVLDLGCGNGLLLRRICEQNPHVEPHGIDSKTDAIAHASELHPTAATSFHVGDLFDCEALWPAGRHYRLVLLMPGRLLEVDPERAATLRARLRERCSTVLVYAYGDWMQRYEGLENLARVAGLELLGHEPGARACLARVAR